MHKVFGTLSLAALLAVFGCSGGNSTTQATIPATPVATHPAPVATGGNPKPQATNGNPKPVSTEGNSKAAASGAITSENSKIEFVGAAPDHKHDGGFKKFSGSLKPIDGDVAKATLNVEIDLNSIWTDDDDKSKKLTPHLKSKDFFDVGKYPTATFVSKEIKAEKKDDNTHVITGDLTLHGKTKSVSFPAKVTTTDDSVTIDGTFTIDRMDFDIGTTFPESKLKKEVPIKVLAKAARK